MKVPFIVSTLTAEVIELRKTEHWSVHLLPICTFRQGIDLGDIGDGK